MSIKDIQQKVQAGIQANQGALSQESSNSKQAMADAKAKGASAAGPIKGGKGKGKKKKISAENLNLSESVSKENIKKGVLNQIKSKTTPVDIQGKAMVDWNAKADAGKKLLAKDSFRRKRLGKRL